MVIKTIGGKNKRIINVNINNHARKKTLQYGRQSHDDEAL
jgi:hypothetical protein